MDGHRARGVQLVRIGLFIARVLCCVCVGIVAAAFTLPEFFSRLGYDIMPYKWLTIFYGGLAMLGSLVVVPVWIAAEVVNAKRRAVADHG